MVIIVSKRNTIILLLTIIVIISCIIISQLNTKVFISLVSNETDNIIIEILDKRNTAILEIDENTLKSMYNNSLKYGVWAYEHELKKMKYLKLWSEKQGVKFTSIKSSPVIRWIKEKDNGYTINFMTSTEYKYVYENDLDNGNLFRIGTYHSLDIDKNEDSYLITREWYTDPFADSLNLDIRKRDEMKKYVSSQTQRDLSQISNRRINAIKYADEYCGAANERQKGYYYNDKYRNYNNVGGDCANFASQILYEGGKFRKNGTWNYNKGGSKAWVNAAAFKNYMLYSGRASLIASGSYEKVFKSSFKLLPGDFIAYGKKGKVTHISTVTGLDSKGYALVNCHNTDRYRVPWDLGWSNQGIKFWLVRVHY